MCSALYFSLAHDQWLRNICNFFRTEGDNGYIRLSKLIFSINNGLMDCQDMPSVEIIKGFFSEIADSYGEHGELSYDAFKRFLYMNIPLRKGVLATIPVTAVPFL